MSKAEMPVFSMVIENGRLVPATPCDQERLDSFRRGTKVRVRFTEEKDRILVRKWWAILGLVVKQCPVPWKTKEEASEAVKLALGIVNITKTIGGDFLAYPKSLTDLEDPELQDAVEQMTELLSRITGVDVETLKKETAHIQPEPDEPHDPATGEILPSADSAPQGSADHGDTPQSEFSPSDVPPNEPAGASVPAPAGSEPDMFGKFNFAAGELVHLQDFAMKALDAAISSDSTAACVAFIEKMSAEYREVIESAEGRKAMAAMDPAFDAMMKGKRTRDQAASYIATEILGCAPEALERRK